MGQPPSASASGAPLGSSPAPKKKAARARRVLSRAGLTGERRRVFDAHPSSIPETQGKLGTASTWRYTTCDGVEIIEWKGNKRVGSASHK